MKTPYIITDMNTEGRHQRPNAFIYEHGCMDKLIINVTTQPNKSFMEYYSQLKILDSMNLPKHTKLTSYFILSQSNHQITHVCLTDHGQSYHTSQKMNRLIELLIEKHEINEFIPSYMVDYSDPNSNAGIFRQQLIEELKKY